ncbi:MAG: hypothetical protein WBQ08_24005 [Candidatus Sulfotelmatobacter sp.]
MTEIPRRDDKRAVRDDDFNFGTAETGSEEILRSSRLKSCGGHRIVLEADFWRRRLGNMIHEITVRIMPERQPADVPPCFWLGGKAHGNMLLF